MDPGERVPVPGFAKDGDVQGRPPGGNGFPPYGLRPCRWQTLFFRKTSPCLISTSSKHASRHLLRGDFAELFEVFDDFLGKNGGIRGVCRLIYSTSPRNRLSNLAIQDGLRRCAIMDGKNSLPFDAALGWWKQWRKTEAEMRGASRDLVVSFSPISICAKPYSRLLSQPAYARCLRHLHQKHPLHRHDRYKPY